jgi:hypothetical protein
MHGVYFVRLPKYWPELNAEELCNGHVRNRLAHKRGSDVFLQEIYDAFATISLEIMENYYRHVIYTPHKA